MEQAKNEEIAILQAGMDQSLLALSELQNVSCSLLDVDMTANVIRI
jgi:hypothetical protein